MLLLHDVFAYPHSEIGDMLGRTERHADNCSAGPGDESQTNDPAPMPTSLRR